MRSLALGIALALLQLCGSEPEAAVPAPSPSAAAPSSFTLSASHGGTVVQVEDHWVEVVTKDSGEVEAYVVDAQGAPAPSAETTVVVEVPGVDQHPHPATLVWDADQARYRGRIEVTPAPGPAEVRLVVRGRPRHARAHRLIVVEAPRHERVVVAPRPGAVVVHPPTPSVVVVRPTPTVVIEERGHPGRGHGRGRGRVEVTHPGAEIRVGGPSIHVGGPSVHVEGPGVRVERGRGRGRGHGRGRH